jgi:osmoprotectant transport system ATP-binding protein
MRMVNRLIDITSGDILLGGRSVTERKPAELRREIGYAIQQTGLFPHLTVGENVATVPKLLGWDRKRISARVDELLALVDLDPGVYRRRYPHQLSGGQQQRVGVARALAADPPVLLMDEPFGALDPVTRTLLQDEFRRLQGELAKTVVFVTHDLDEAVRLGDRIAVLAVGGVLEQYDTPSEVLGRPATPFVESFVGGDRAVKRLAVLALGREHVEPVVGALDPGPGAGPGGTVALGTSLREVLSRLLLSERGWLVVVDGDGRVVGTVNADRVVAAARDRAPLPVE